MRDEHAIEKEIQTKGLVAPRLTPSHIDKVIASNWYIVPPGTTLTICVLTLVNGFHVVGYSAAASSDNFDEEIGRKIAFDNARQKIWPLEGYLLRDRLASTTDARRLKDFWNDAVNKKSEEIPVTYQEIDRTWRTPTGEEVPALEVVTKSPGVFVWLRPDQALGDAQGKLIGRDRTEEGAPSFKD